MINYSHPFKMDGSGVPDRPCALCGLPDRDPVHIPGPVDLNAPEPPPIPVPGATPIWQLVIEDMKHRHEMGVAKYGQPLVARDGRKSLSVAYQEALDLAVYIRKEIRERSMNRVDYETITLTPLELAAPQLLKACHGVITYHFNEHREVSQSDLLKLVEAAITKAEGPRAYADAIAQAQHNPTGDDPKAETVPPDSESPK